MQNKKITIKASHENSIEEFFKSSKLILDIFVLVLSKSKGFDITNNDFFTSLIWLEIRL